MPPNHFILCCPFLLPPSIFPIIRIFFFKDSFLRIRWPKYWNFSFNVSPSNEYSGLFPLGLSGWTFLLSKGLSRVFSNTTVQKHQFFSSQPSLWSSSYIHTWLLEKPKLVVLQKILENSVLSFKTLPLVWCLGFLSNAIILNSFHDAIEWKKSVAGNRLDIWPGRLNTWIN